MFLRVAHPATYSRAAENGCPTATAAARNEDGHGFGEMDSTVSGLHPGALVIAQSPTGGPGQPAPSTRAGPRLQPKKWNPGVEGSTALVTSTTSRLPEVFSPTPDAFRTLYGERKKIRAPVLARRSGARQRHALLNKCRATDWQKRAPCARLLGWCGAAGQEAASYGRRDRQGARVAKTTDSIRLAHARVFARQQRVFISGARLNRHQKEGDRPVTRALLRLKAFAGGEAGQRRHQTYAFLRARSRRSPVARVANLLSRVREGGPCRRFRKAGRVEGLLDNDGPHVGGPSRSKIGSAAKVLRGTGNWPASIWQTLPPLGSLWLAP